MAPLFRYLSAIRLLLDVPSIGSRHSLCLALSLSSSELSETSRRGTIDVDQGKKHLERWQATWEGSDNPGFHRKLINVALTQLGHYVNLAPITVKSHDYEQQPQDCESSSDASAGKGTGGVPGGSLLRVLVPFCGKSHDMAYLASHPNTTYLVGVEAVAKPIETFSIEHPEFQLVKEESNNGADDTYSSFHKWKGRGVEIWQGDFLDFPPSTLLDEERFDVIYDRGALVAIDPLLRTLYLQATERSIKSGTGKILLVVVERNPKTTQTAHPGPPHHFSEQDVRDLYLSQPWVASVTSLANQQIIDPDDDPEKWVSKYFLIQAK